MAANARAPWGQLPAIAPVPAGGMNIDRVAEMLAVYGPDTILLIGGALLAAGPALPARSREFVAAVAGHLPLGGPS